MRIAVRLACLLLFACEFSFAAGTVQFGMTWYPASSLGGIVIADFNRDGIPDVAYTSGSNFVIKMGLGGGKLGPDISYGTSEQNLDGPIALDIDGDGWLDLIAFNQLDNEFVMLGNNGDGTFHYIGGIPVPNSYIGSLTAGDFNHDGKPDLAIVSCADPYAGWPTSTTCGLYIYLGARSPTYFTQGQTIPLNGGRYGVQAWDINGDSNLDLVFAGGGKGIVWVGNGDGTFHGHYSLTPPTTDPVDWATVADFNDDGRLDIALLSGQPCHPTCGDGGPNTVWMYKNNGGTNFTLTGSRQLAAYAGNIVSADVDGDLNPDIIYYNHFAMGIDPQLQNMPQGATFFAYALGSGNDTLGSEGSLPDNDFDTAVAFRDMDLDSRADYVVWDWNEAMLGVGIQTGGDENCPPPSSAYLAAKICGIANGATAASPVLVRASGNSPAGVTQLQVWIDGKKQYVKWGDQLARTFTLSPGAHRIVVVANDRYVGSAKTSVVVTVP